MKSDDTPDQHLNQQRLAAADANAGTVLAETSEAALLAEYDDEAASTTPEPRTRRYKRKSDRKSGRPRKWVSDTTLAVYFEVSRCTIWRWTKIGVLPPPRKFGERTTRWDFEASIKRVDANSGDLS